MADEVLVTPAPEIQVESIVLAPALERKLGEATVRLGDFKIREITIWRRSNGAIDVYLPSTRSSRYGGWLTPHGSTTSSRCQRT